MLSKVGFRLSGSIPKGLRSSRLPRLILLLGVAMLACANAGPALAATSTFVGGATAGNWSTASNWNPSSASGAGNEAFFALGGLRA